MKNATENQRSFQAILEEKLAVSRDTKNSSTDSVINLHINTVFPSENYNFAFTIPFAPTRAALHLSSYFTKISKKAAQKPAPKIIKSEPFFMIEKLSTRAQLALNELAVEREFENKQISAAAVKSAYRKMARRHHPDLNPTSSGEKFNEYRELAQIILSELKQLSPESVDT